MHIKFHQHELTALYICWLLPVITTSDVFLWLCIVLKHVFNHDKLNCICEVKFKGPMRPEASFITEAFLDCLYVI